MAAPLVYSLAPVKLNSTVLAVDNLTFTPDVRTQPFRHSGNEFASVMAVTGGAPAIRFRTPFLEAYNLIGWKFLKCTTVEVQLAKFVDALRQTGSVHRKYTLATAPGSAFAYAYMTGASVAQNGIFMADVSVVFISYDGMTNPLTSADNTALLTLAAEPSLFTLGPSNINGTDYAGATNVRVDLSASFTPTLSSGDLYPRAAAYLGGDPSLTIDHIDPATIWASIYPLGITASSLVQYFKAFSSQVVSLSGGLSLTISSGRAVPDAISASNLQIAQAPIKFIPLSNTATFPIVLATGATVPTP